MSRQPEIEKILEAWWELDHGAEREKARFKLNELLDAAVAKSGGSVNRYQIQSALWDRYKSFRAEKRQQAKVQIAQSMMRQS